MRFLSLPQAFIHLSNSLHAKTFQAPLEGRRNPMDVVYVGILVLFVLLAYGLLALCEKV